MKAYSMDLRQRVLADCDAGLATQAVAEGRRRDIFLALVAAQDQAMGVAQSRTLVAERFGVSEQQVREIEQEGLERQWPPLGD
jgi:hypothetical protein